MMLNYIALLTALSISGVAAYYSIYGLTAIFSGVFWPIVIMGSVLEVGKIVSTVWLHTYWHHLKLSLKAYMSLAVVILMFITSMGIFGFLSKAHIEVTSQAGGGELLVQQVDQNIAIEQRRIDDARKVMAQMDDAVAGLLKGSGANAERDNNRTAAMTTQATKLRESQKKERDSLNASIDNANSRIAELSRQKLKLNQEQLKMEAEVGPIKYIAQLIYDDGASKDMMERAVRWVIIVIVTVFDPLAVSMVLGVTIVMNNRRREHDLSEHEAVRDSQGNRDIELPVGVVREVERIVEVEVPVEVVREVEVTREVPVEVIREVERVVVEQVVDNTEIQRLEEELAETLVMLEDSLNKPAEIQYVDRIVEKTVQVPVEVIKEVVVTDNTNLTALTRELDVLLQENLRKENQIHALKAELKIKDQEQSGISADEFDDEVNTSLLGTQLPDTAETGQLYLNIKTEKLYKYTGTDWLEVDKNMNVSYTLDEHWQNWKLGQLTRGETEWDDLTVAEQSALEQKAV